MAVDIIGSLYIISLVAGIIHLSMMYLQSGNTAKQYAATARFWVLTSMFCSMAFYNYSSHSEYFNNNSYTLLFILWMNTYIYILFGLSSTWFYAQNETGRKYYILILMADICFGMLLTTCNIYFLWLSFVGVILINGYLINYNKKKEEKRIFSNMWLPIIILTIAVGCWGKVNGNTGNFHNLTNFFLNNSRDVKAYIISIGVILPFFYVFGVAPFHMNIKESLDKSILPVSQYIAVIQPIVWWGVIIKMTHVLQPAYQSNLESVYNLMAIISVITGGLGINSKVSLQRMYAYSSLYFYGCALFLLSIFQKGAEFSSFIVLFSYLLSLNGLYAIGYNLKSHGTYLNTPSTISGLAQTRPGLAFFLLICIFSLLGLPPLAGFSGQINILYYLIANEKYIILSVICALLLWMAKAYLEIIRNIYAEQKFKNFDVENKFATFFTILICGGILTIMYNPGNIIEKMKDMYDVIWL